MPALSKGGGGAVPIPVPFLMQGDQIALHCARPTRALLGRALREHKGRSGCPALFPLFAVKLASGAPPNFSSNNTLNDWPVKK